MPTRNVVLTDEQAAFVSELVSSGDYQNASETIRAGLRLLQADRDHRSAEIDGLRAGIAEGLAQAQRGEFAEGSAKDVIARAFARTRRQPEA